MMDHKKRVARDATARIMLMISDIGEDEKQELYEKYYIADKPLTISESAQIVLIGNWVNNATKMLLRGATEEELKNIVEHIIILIGLRKYNLDIKKSYKDHDLLNLTRKYFSKDEIVEIKVKESEKRKENDEREAAFRKAAKVKAQALRAEGLSNAEVAEKLELPESTIRTLTEEK